MDVRLRKRINNPPNCRTLICRQVVECLDHGLLVFSQSIVGGWLLSHLVRRRMFWLALQYRIKIVC